MYSSVQIPMQVYKDHEESGNMMPPQETNKLPISDPKEMEIYRQCKEFRIILLKKFSELQEHTNN